MKQSALHNRQKRKVQARRKSNRAYFEKKYPPMAFEHLHEAITKIKEKTTS